MLKVFVFKWAAALGVFLMERTCPCVGVFMEQFYTNDFINLECCLVSVCFIETWFLLIKKIIINVY